MTTERKHVIIYTDGGCAPNPGPGGYGIVLRYGNARKTLSGGFRRTTNNRMELYAAIRALESLKEPCQVTLYSDSSYLVEGIRQGWAERWKKQNWMRTPDERTANADLWERLLELCQIHNVTFVWVKGHSGNEENKMCDQLSQAALKQPNLPVDEGFENAPKIKVKITQAGQPCRKCGTPVVKKKPHKPPQAGQRYYYEYYLYCPVCKTMYLVDNARRQCDSKPPRLIEP